VGLQAISHSEHRARIACRSLWFYCHFPRSSPNTRDIIVVAIESCGVINFGRPAADSLTRHAENHEGRLNL
jgi:hypothetical protein